MKTRFQIFLTQDILQFFKMHNLYIMWLYALQFVACEVIVDAFNWLYSKLLPAKLCLFVFGATFVESHWQFFSVCSFIRD